MIRVGDFYIVIERNIARMRRARPAFLEAKHALIAGVHDDGQALEVQQDIGDIFLHALNGGVFMQHAFNFSLDHGRARHGRQQHTPERVAERMAKAAIQRFNGNSGGGLARGLHIHPARF